jgi:hypothetical protein
MCVVTVLGQKVAEQGPDVCCDGTGTESSRTGSSCVL